MPDQNLRSPGLLDQSHPAFHHTHDLEERITRLEAMVNPMFVDYAKTYDNHHGPLDPGLPAVDPFPVQTGDSSRPLSVGGSGYAEPLEYQVSGVEDNTPSQGYNEGYPSDLAYDAKEYDSTGKVVAKESASTGELIPAPPEPPAPVVQEPA